MNVAGDLEIQLIPASENEEAQVCADPTHQNPTHIAHWEVQLLCSCHFYVCDKSYTASLGHIVMSEAVKCAFCGAYNSSIVTTVRIRD